MPRDVAVTITNTIPGVLPPGVAQGLTRFSLLSTDLPPIVIAVRQVTGLSALFTGIENGEYAVEVQVLDTGGGTLGVPLTQPVTVTDLLFQQPVGSLSVVVT